MSGRLIPGHHFYQSQSRGMDSQSETRKSSDVQINDVIIPVYHLGRDFTTWSMVLSNEGFE
jgi:hypothetical protein